MHIAESRLCTLQLGIWLACFTFSMEDGNVIGADVRSVQGWMSWGRPYKKGYGTSIYGWESPYKGARALLQHLDALQRALDLLRGPRHLRQVARRPVHACRPGLHLLMIASGVISLRTICLSVTPRYAPGRAVFLHGARCL